MPRTIKSEDTTEYVVALVLTVAIGLTLVVAGLELMTKFFPKVAPKLASFGGYSLARKTLAQCGLASSITTAGSRSSCL